MRELTENELELVSGSGDITLDTITIESRNPDTSGGGVSGSGGSNYGGTGEKSVVFGDITISKILYQGVPKFVISKNNTTLRTYGDERTMLQKLSSEFGIKFSGFGRSLGDSWSNDK